MILRLVFSLETWAGQIYPDIGLVKNLSAIGKRNREISNIVQALAVILIQPDYQSETFLLIEHHSCLTTGKCGTKNTVHILNRKTILRQAVTVVVDLYLCQSGNFLHIDICNAFNLLNDFLN